MPNLQVSLTGHYLACQMACYTWGKVEGWAIPEKNQTEGLRTYFLNSPIPLEMLGFLLHPCEFQTKQSFTLRNSTKFCETPRKFQGLKPRPLEILHDHFLITSGNSTLFLINPWKFLNCYFFNTPWNPISSTPLLPLWSFSEIA